MKVGSLFSGVGGLDLALEELGFELAWQIEDNPFCNKVLAQHWPEVKRYGDIRKLDLESLERVDAICGGFPCQPWSVAGQNRGESDDRNLWPETIGIIRVLQPRYVFLENVPGLLTHEYFGTILGDLAGGGYDAEWGCFTAGQVGASHRRDRLFILAHSQRRQLSRRGEPGDLACASREVEGEGLQRQRVWDSSGDGGGSVDDPEHYGRTGPEVPRSTGLRTRNSETWKVEPEQLERSSSGARRDEGVADADLGQLPVGTGFRGDNGAQQSPLTGSGGLRFPPAPNDLDAWACLLTEMPTLEPALCRVAYGTPDRTHRLKALGNSVVPIQAVNAFRELMERYDTA